LIQRIENEGPLFALLSESKLLVIPQLDCLSLSVPRKTSSDIEGCRAFGTSCRVAA
jgi:hypothetical protein